MKIPKSTLQSFHIAALVFLIACSAKAQDAVTNGSFESGFSPGWTSVDTDGFSGVGSSPLFANSGSRYAFLGTSTTSSTLTQVLTTTPGQSYTLSFSLANDSSVSLNSFQASFDGTTVLSLTNSAAFGYTTFTFPGLAATTSSTALQFQYRNDDDFFRLDSVSAVVPEPSSLLLIAPALVIVGLMRRRRATRFGVFV